MVSLHLHLSPTPNLSVVVTSEISGLFISFTQINQLITLSRLRNKIGMVSLRALYLNFKKDFGDLLEVTDFSIATWLAFGASLQLLSQSWLPSGLSYWVPLLYLVYRIARVCIDCSRIFTGSFTNVMFGRWSATLPEPEDPSTVSATSDGVVMFLLGARINQCVPFSVPRRHSRD